MRAPAIGYCIKRNHFRRNAFCITESYMLLYTTTTHRPLIPFLKTDYMTTFSYRQNSGVIQDRRVRHREVSTPTQLAPRGRDGYRPPAMPQLTAIRPVLLDANHELLQRSMVSESEKTLLYFLLVLTSWDNERDHRDSSEAQTNALSACAGTYSGPKWRVAALVAALTVIW